MKTITYKTHWSYLGSVKRRGSLVDLVLDIPYLMEESGVIPPLAILNEVFQSGGDSGGMGPGTTWKPFQIDTVEYAELVDALLNLDIEVVREAHPYVKFKKIVIDPELDMSTDHLNWLKSVQAKYSSDR